MTFKEYLQTKKGKIELKNYLKKHPEVKKKIKRIQRKIALPISKDSRHMDPSTMGTTGNLPAATQGNQPEMS
jgi:hypothetical protein